MYVYVPQFQMITPSKMSKYLPQPNMAELYHKTAFLSKDTLQNNKNITPDLSEIIF